jgi:hypothetical protein
MRIRFMTDLIQECFLFDPSAFNTPFPVGLHPEAIQIQFAARRLFQYGPPGGREGKILFKSRLGNLAPWKQK